MPTKRKRRAFRIFIILTFGALLTLGALMPLQGQGDIVLTIATPSWMGDLFRPEFFADFEAAHPGVKVVNVPDQGDWYGSATGDLDAALEKWAEYASIADVVYMPGWLGSPFATRAGLWLDLKPLITADPNIDIDDFYPSILGALAWDGGQWALPVTGEIQIFVYDRIKFDEAGIPYPNQNWTLQDVTNAALALTTYQEDGDIDVPGIGGYSPGILLGAFSGVSLLADDGSFTPNFQALAPMIEEWSAFQDEIRVEGQYDYDAVPFHISQPWQLTNNFGANQEERDWQGALLPNIGAVVDAQGFAVSAGTMYPELAYELAKSMTTDAEVVNRFFSTMPARKSMVGVKMPDDSEVFFSAPEIEPEVQALFEEAVTNGVPRSNFIFEEFLWTAINEVSENDADPVIALQDAEQNVLEALDTAEAFKQTAVVAVATPVPTPIVGEGQIVLKFGAGMDPSYQPDGWDQTIADFVAANPNIGDVDVVEQFFSGEDLQSLDCFFTNGSLVSAREDLNLLPLDPFLDADPNFDRDDVLPGVLEQLSADGMTYGYPVTVSPAVLWYDSELFTEAGLPAPETSEWNVESFRDALETLRAHVEDADDPVFQPEQFGNTYLLMLIAAHGGVPYDFRTDPATLNLTDPATQDAVRQVLDMAKENLIAYSELVGNNSFSSGMGAPIFDDTLTVFSWRMQNRSNPDYDMENLRLTNFPSGSQFTPVAFSVGALYIQADAQDPEACYKLVQSLGQKPNLFGGMPAFRSLLNDPTVQAVQGDDVAILFQQFAERMSDPNAVSLPSAFGGAGSSSPGAWLEQNFLNRAFDQYVLEDVDLAQAMNDAQANIETYRECTAPIPPPENMFDMDMDASRAYYRQYTDCALALDESLRSQFSWYYEDEE